MRPGDVPWVSGADNGASGESCALRAGIEEYLGRAVRGILKNDVRVAILDSSSG
jgi:hypothetical protein